MYKNYFYLSRCVDELKSLLTGKRIIEAYTQEKDKLFLHVPDNVNPYFHVIISVNPQQPYITFKHEHHKAKKNTASFFVGDFPAVIRSFSIAFGDRIILIELENARLFIFFRGAQSNIYFVNNDGNVKSFKKITGKESKEIVEEISQIEFVDSAKTVLDRIGNGYDENKMRKMNSIGKEIMREAELRGGAFTEKVLDVLNEVNNSKIAVYFDPESNKPRFHPSTFKTFRLPEDRSEFESYSEALNKYFSLTFTKNKEVDIRKQIEKYLNAEIERLANKLNNLKARVENGSKENIYRRNADLLLANIYRLRKGMKEMALEEFPANKETLIVLDEKLSPNKNIEKYYDKARSEKIEFEKSKQFLQTASKEYGRLIGLREKLDKTDNQEDLLAIKKELKMKTQHSPSEDKSEKFSFRHYILAGKYHIYVGKDSKNNDQLTTKFAKQNDFWFHARSVSGSHVVLRVENTKEVIPKNILQNVASIAAFYSKAKTSKLASVTYTLKKYVIKNQRHEPGQVTVTKENVLLVKPEIPKYCEQITE